MTLINLLTPLFFSTLIAQTVIFHYKSESQDTQVESVHFQRQSNDSMFDLDDGSNSQSLPNRNHTLISGLTSKARNHILQLTSSMYKNFDFKLFEEQLKENFLRLAAQGSLPACPLEKPGKKKSPKTSGVPLIFWGTASQRDKLFYKDQFFFIEVSETGKLKNPFMQHFVSMFKVKCYPSLVLATSNNGLQLLEGLEALKLQNQR